MSRYKAQMVKFPTTTNDGPALDVYAVPVADYDPDMTKQAAKRVALAHTIVDETDLYGGDPLDRN